MSVVFASVISAVAVLFKVVVFLIFADILSPVLILDGPNPSVVQGSAVSLGGLEI